MAGYVIDASVLVEIFVAGSGSDKCLTLIDEASGLYAPDAIYHEVAGALRRYELQGRYREMLEDVTNLSDLDLITTSARDLLLPAVEISSTHVIGIYDSFYLALSERLRLPLATVDAKLANAVAHKPFNVIYVGGQE